MIVAFGRFARCPAPIVAALLSVVPLIGVSQA